MDTELKNFVDQYDTTVSLNYKDTLAVPSLFEFNLPVIMKTGHGISAMSLGFYYPEEYLEITGIEPANDMKGINYYATDGLFNMVWSDVNPVFITDEDTVLTLKMRSLDLAGLSGTIKLGLYEISEFADQSANIIEGVVLEIPEIVFLIPDSEDSLSGNYVEVYPNPFDDQTSVNFYLKAESRVKISLYNLAGSEIDLFEETSYPEGSHQVRLNGIDLAKGVYLLNFEIRNSEIDVSRLIKIISIR